MVHRKTEYRRKFRRPSLTVQKTLYDENIKYRKQRKLDEFSHQPLGTSEWDVEFEEDDDSLDISPPKTRTKHKELLEKWLESQQTINTKSSTHQSDTKQNVEIGVQTPRWDWKTSLLHDQGTQVESNGCSFHLSGIRSAPTGASPILASSPKSKLDKVTKISRGKPKKRQLTSPKELLKSKTIHKKPPFHSYGWADEETSIGDKKSHNVFAGKNQVFNSTIRARKRKQLIDKSKDKQQDSMPQIANVKCSSKISNESSVFQRTRSAKNIWQTEYQRSFARSTKPS